MEDNQTAMINHNRGRNKESTKQAEKKNEQNDRSKPTLIDNNHEYKCIEFHNQKM